MVYIGNLSAPKTSRSCNMGIMTCPPRNGASLVSLSSELDAVTIFRPVKRLFNNARNAHKVPGQRTRKKKYHVQKTRTRELVDVRAHTSRCHS